MRSSPSPRQMAQIRRAVEAQFDTSCCLLLRVPGVNDIGDATKNGYTATIGPAFFRTKRFPKIGDVDQVQKLSDWSLRMAFTVIASTKMIALQGVQTWKGPYDAGTAYIIGDGVNVGEKFYVSIQAGTNKPVTNMAYWMAAPTFQIIGTNMAASNKASLLADLKLIS